MVLSKEEYIKKYVGKINTSTPIEKYKNSPEYTIVKSIYPGLSKVYRKYPHRDITAYIVGRSVYVAKNNVDKGLKSKKQYWEL